jgi:MFS family permease
VQPKLVNHSPIIRGESDRPSFSIAKIIVYFGVLNLVLGLASPAGMLGIPISYLLKDHFHLRPVETATFWAVTSSPFCVAFLFGFLRDRFRSTLGGDRGWIALGSAAAVACYLCLALMDLDLRALTVLVLIVFVCFVFMSAAAGAMLTAVAQARLMSGTLSTTSQSGAFVPGVLAALAGGWIVSHLSVRGTFVAGAVVTVFVLIQMMVSVNPEATIRSDSRSESSLAAIKRVATYRPIWTASLIWFLWSFSPGYQTPMFYHLTNTVKISPQALGLFSALFLGFNLPTMLLYGALCRRFPFSRWLWWGTVLGILQPAVMLCALGTRSAMLVGVIGGLMSGLGQVALLDLVIRSCPRGLEGTGIMLATAAYVFAINLGNVFGSWIYAQGGFSTAMFITAVSTALILPVIWIVPPAITASREGEGVELARSSPPG